MRKHQGEHRVPNTALVKVDKDCLVDSNWVKEWVALTLTVAAWHNRSVKTVKICRSLKKGWHAYVELNEPVDATTANRIAWILGDDATRTDYNRARIESGMQEWSKMFERVNVRLLTTYDDSWPLWKRNRACGRFMLPGQPITVPAGTRKKGKEG